MLFLEGRRGLKKEKRERDMRGAFIVSLMIHSVLCLGYPIWFSSGSTGHTFFAVFSQPKENATEILRCTLT